MSDQQEARLGHLIGEYRLVRKLGGGGFGTVYLAEHVHEHTRVAVKMLHISLAKSKDFKNFINEARTIRLHHPHILPLLDFGISHDDLPFLVMEYAPEGTLRDRHPKGACVPLPTIVSYVDQLASALQYAHDQRVIHRDVKPENILVRADGTLLVSDFGIAKLLEQSVLISQQTQVGTPTYMAPEQNRGYPCFASDQYALAVVVYEWICGVRPFQGTALSLVVQHMKTPPPSLRDHRPEISEAVERVIFKALAKAPEDRYARIEEMASVLHEAVQPPPSTIILSPAFEAMNTASLIAPQVSRQASGPRPESLAQSVTGAESARPGPALSPFSQDSPKNAASPSSQKRPPGRRFSLLTVRPLGLIILLIVLVATLFGSSAYYFIYTSDYSTSPLPGTPTPQQTPSAMKMPNLVRMSLDQAQQLLKSKGVLSVKVQVDSSDPDDPHLGADVVTRTDPPAGETLLTRQMITLYVTNPTQSTPTVQLTPTCEIACATIWRRESRGSPEAG